MKSFKEMVDDCDIQRPVPIEHDRAATEKQFMERQHDMHVSELIRNSRLPQRHLDTDIDPTPTDHPWALAFYKAAKKIMDGGGAIIGLCGTRGNGKTQLAVEIARSQIQDLHTVRYLTAMGFFTAVKDSYSDRHGSTSDVLWELRRPDLLVIDEVGKRSDSQWENNLLFELVNHRYNDLKPTILIDNRSKEEFLAGVGPSIASRMQETGGIIEANWESFRK